ncbi:MAG: pyrrolo-quinoline quinone [Candidatus Binataceae bacterium]|nr:pyrrolo-quinoline quinone [Candidatus Binataceae bacterium]
MRTRILLMKSRIRQTLSPCLLAMAALCLAGSPVLAAAKRPAKAPAFHGVLTYHYDNARTGVNPEESMLTPGNVNPQSFGKLFSYPVDGYVYAQPLYVRNVMIPKLGAHNVIFIVTEHNSVYAFDADGNGAAPLWQRSLINPAAGVTSVAAADVLSQDIVPEVGITSTPVIDSVGTLYVVAKTKENGSYVQRLHALDIATGKERPNSPRVITATVTGTGDGRSAADVVTFNPLRANQRSALAEVKGMIYAAFASHGDNGPYHGWVLGYGSRTLKLFQTFNVTPNGGDGGIWQGANGPAADASGALYIASGNGTFDADSGGVDYGDSAIKLVSRMIKHRPELTVADYFTPYDQTNLSAKDIDFGTTGAIVLPDQPVGPKHLLLVANKSGTVYLLDRDNLGHYNVDDDSQIVQELPAMLGMTYTPPAYFNGHVYFGPQNRPLLSFPLVNGQISIDGEIQGGDAFGFPGVVPSVSANGTANGIVWVIQSDQYASSGPAVLYAYDASTLTELYDSNMQGTRDIAGPAVKFTTPTIANGKVYLGTQQTVDVYGLLSP